MSDGRKSDRRGPATKLKPKIERLLRSPEALFGYAQATRAAERLRSETTEFIPEFRDIKVRRPKRADLQAFGKRLTASLSSKGLGFSLMIAENGRTVFAEQVGWAENETGYGVKWRSDTKQEVASVSKLLNSIGMMRLLFRKGVSFDRKISEFLPAHWKLGPKGKSMDFRSILSHERGLWNGEPFAYGSGGIGYFDLKRQIEEADFAIEEGMHYSNPNFGLLRVIIPIMNGDLDRETTFDLPYVALSNDQVWDLLTQNHFAEYMKSMVFEPSGVSASLKSNRLPVEIPGIPPMNVAIGYAQPNSDDLVGQDVTPDASALGGAIGWHLSVEELLRVAENARRRGSIVSRRTLNLMFRERFGSFPFDTDAGRIHYHDGAWTIGGDYGIVSYLGFLPNEAEVALLINHNIKTIGLTPNLVHNEYVASIV